MIYLNGQWQPLAQASVSVLDRGFLFADGVYEVVPVYSRHPFRLDEHLRRLQASLDSIRLANPLSQAQWRELILQAIAQQDFADQQVYVQVTRGCGPNRDFPFPDPVQPSTLIYPMPLITASAELKAQGVSAISREDYRWLRCDIKSTSLLGNVLMRQFAAAAVCAAFSVLLVWRVAPAGAPLRPGKGDRGHWRCVLRDRRILAFCGGYFGHNWELFGFRAWLVAYLSWTHARSPDA